MDEVQSVFSVFLSADKQFATALSKLCVHLTIYRAALDADRDHPAQTRIR